MLRLCLSISSLWLLLGVMSPQVGAQASKLAYEVEFTGLEEIGLDDQAQSLSRLVSERGNPPTSAAGLARRVDTDQEMLNTLLRAESYFDAQINAQTITNEDGGITVHLDVTPGPRFTVSELRIELFGNGEENELASLRQSLVLNAPIFKNVPARAEDILATERLILGRLPQMGYPFAELVERRVVVDHDSIQVLVHLKLSTGPRVLFGPLQASGLTSVSLMHVKKFQSWQQGELYDQRLVDNMRAKLTQSGLFSSISLSPLPPEDLDIPGPIEQPVQLQATEAQHRTISLGAGFSTAEGPNVEAGWTHRNFFGSGEKLELTGRAATLEQSLRADFTKPAFLIPEQRLLAALALAREDTDAFTSYGASGSLGIERALSEQWSLSIGTNAEVVAIDENGAARTFTLAALPTALRWDGTDDKLDPKKGGRMAVTVTPEIGLQDGLFGFTKTTLSGSVYQAVGEQQWLVLAARAKLGSILGPRNTRLPANRRFFAGGGGSIRGFGYQDVGPLSEDDDPVGGRSVVEFGFETRLRLSDSIGIVPFIEGGNVYESRYPKLSDLRWGAGLGARYYTEFAPIRVDVAIPLNRRARDHSFQLYISIGQSF